MIGAVGGSQASPGTHGDVPLITGQADAYSVAVSRASRPPIVPLAAAPDGPFIERAGCAVPGRPSLYDPGGA